MVSTPTLSARAGSIRDELASVSEIAHFNLDRAAERIAAAPGWTRQRFELEALIAAATKARDAADRDHLFESHSGRALVNAIYDLIEVDAVYDLANEIGRELGVDEDGEPILYLADRGRA